MPIAHEIDYRIYGEEMQYVDIELDPGETAVAESGAFMMMDDGIQMQTIFGDGSRPQGMGGGLLDKLFSAGKRLLTGESLFMTAFTNIAHGKKKVAFASPYPGKIIPLDLSQLGGKVVCQKDAFLCAARGVNIGIEFQRRLGTGLFGGEGFIMQKLEGDGFAVAVFLAAAFFTAFFTADFLAGAAFFTALLIAGFALAVFLAEPFLAAAFFTGATFLAPFFTAAFFTGAAFLAPFFTAAFLGVTFLAAPFFAGATFLATFFEAAFLAAAFFAGAAFLAAFLGAAFLIFFALAMVSKFK